MYRGKGCDSFPFRAVFCLLDVQNLVKKAGKGRVGEGAGALSEKTLQLNFSLLATKYFGMWGRCEASDFRASKENIAHFLTITV